MLSIAGARGRKRGEESMDTDAGKGASGEEGKGRSVGVNYVGGRARNWGEDENGVGQKVKGRGCDGIQGGDVRAGSLGMAGLGIA